MLTVYLILPALLVAVVMASVWLERWSVPVILVALGTGILCGSDVLNLWHFADMVLTNQCANLALVFILFHGGFMTKRANFRAVALPASGLATWGVLLTAVATFALLRWVLGWSMEVSLLLSVIISSTDAAAIFSIMRRPGGVVVAAVREIQSCDVHARFNERAHHIRGTAAGPGVATAVAVAIIVLIRAGAVELRVLLAAAPVATTKRDCGCHRWCTASSCLSALETSGPAHRSGG